jgi:EmrB/QacA subfamily drug resistance transporter
MAGTGIPPAGRGRSRSLALAILCTATLMIILDGTIVTVALPSIQRDLGFAPANLTWVLNAYMIAFGGLLLLAGRLGDLLGRKRMFLAGLAVFTAASLACGLAGNQEMLIAARFVQGAGAAMVSAVSLGMIVGLYTEQRERAKAIAAFSFVGAAGASVGLVLGGVLTEAISWHWIFFVNLPIGVLAGLPGLRLLPGDRGAGLRGGADALGAVLVTAGLMTGVYALVAAAQYGWISARTLGVGGLAIALIGAFLLRQATAARPLLQLRIFSSRSVSGANLAQALVIAAAFGFQVLIALYLQRVLGYTPAAAGLGLLPTAVVIGTVSLGFSARLAGRFGERAVLLTGLGLVAIALALLTRVPTDGSYLTHLLAPVLIFGAGGGLTLPALATLGMSDATPDDAGLVSGLFGTTQQVGAAVGVALLSTLAASHSAQLLHGGWPAAAALTSGYRLAFTVGAGLTFGAFIVAATILRPRPRPRPRPRVQAQAQVQAQVQPAPVEAGSVEAGSATMIGYDRDEPVNGSRHGAQVCSSSRSAS